MSSHTSDQSYRERKAAERKAAGRGLRPLLAEIKASIKAVLYRLYERRLERKLITGRQPQHIGLILDGNRRFGRRRRIADPHALYALGADKLDDLLSWCTSLGIPAVTLWVCSTKNLQRPSEEVTGILGAIQEKLTDLAGDPFIHQHHIRVRAAGRLDLLPPSTRTAIEEAEQATRDHSAIVLTIAVAYDGREELVDALKSMLRQKLAGTDDPAKLIDEISAETIGQHVYSPDLPDPDLIIRTSGELRLSGFLLWEASLLDPHHISTGIILTFFGVLLTRLIVLWLRIRSPVFSGKRG